MRDNNVDGDDGEINEDGGGVDGVDGDGSGGTSPSRRVPEQTSVPQNWSTTAAALWNFIWENTDCLRVFASEDFYRQRVDVRGWPRPPHHRVARPGGHPCHQVV
jgi:hypothetical protein